VARRVRPGSVAGVLRALAVSDEEVSYLDAGHAAALGVDLLIGAGDLSFDYLGVLIDLVNRPGVFVPGNHDSDLPGFPKPVSSSLRTGLPKKGPGPAGFVNADGRVVDVGGVRVAGLGGCLRYRPGLNQWSEIEQARRGRRVVRAARRLRRRDGGDVDILLTHAPPRHCGDREDLPHRGFECLHDVVAALQPRLLVHGHIHPYGQAMPDRLLGQTAVVNVVGHRVLVL
jgi:calcineurin-like phosphoesterase family protein